MIVATQVTSDGGHGVCVEGEAVNASGECTATATKMT